jgi:hypothetical protein
MFTLFNYAPPTLSQARWEVHEMGMRDATATVLLL